MFVVSKQDILALRERVHTTHVRLKRVQGFRKNLFTNIEKTQKKINNHVVKLLFDENSHEKYGVLKKFFDTKGGELALLTERERYSNKVLLDVLNHSRHIPRILDLFYSLPDSVRVIYKHYVDALSKCFNIIRKYIEERFMPNTLAQQEALNRFLRNDGVAEFIFYLELYREGKHYRKQLENELKPILSVFKKSLQVVRNGIKNIHKLSEHHRNAIAILCVGLFLFSILTPFIPHGAGFISAAIGVLHPAANIGHWFFEVKELNESFSALMTAPGK